MSKRGPKPSGNTDRLHVWVRPDVKTALQRLADFRGEEVAEAHRYLLETALIENGLLVKEYA